MPSSPESKSERRTIAPLIAGAIVVVAVLAVVIFNWLKPTPQLTVDMLKSPVVGGYAAGGDLYPPTSEFAVGEMAKFGYLPELPVARTSDGVLVAATDSLLSERMGMNEPVSEVTSEEFLNAQITPPTENGKPSSPLTIEKALTEYGKSTVFVFTIEAENDARDVAELVKKHSQVESVIFRSQDPGVLKVAQNENIASLVPNPQGSPEELKQAGVDMVDVGADADPQPYANAGLKVWAHGVKDPNHLSYLATKGFYGAFSGNPFSIQPSSVKTD